MTGEAPRTTRDPVAEHPCPACGRLRDVLPQRHKVLGAWVPEWEVLSCRNPECPRYVPPPTGDDADDPGTDAANASTTQVTGKNAETGRSPAPG
ncbi:hypothetical protein [Streptomyces sp. NPDC090025]|uniref:hypothetical protein n=1 Tax=Streptomyces sp. NPDC090025 TaxID=3365922 RepID=UPI003838188A